MLFNAFTYFFLAIYFMMSLFNSAFGNFKEKFRKIEKLSRKCVNLQGAIVFNRTCLNNGLYPKFIYIYIYLQSRGEAHYKYQAKLAHATFWEAVEAYMSNFFNSSC